MQTIVIVALVAILVLGLVIYFATRPNSGSADGADGNDGDDGNDDAPEEDGDAAVEAKDEDEAMKGDGVVFFGSPGCPACTAFKPIFAEASLGVRYPFRFMNLANLRDRRFLRRHSIRAIPHVVAVRGGKVVGTFNGRRNALALRRFARRHRARK